MIVDLTQDRVVCEVDHRCGFHCFMQQMRASLPLDGRMEYTYADFYKLFVPMNTDAIALPAHRT